jgi:hypothetical protein
MAGSRSKSHILEQLAAERTRLEQTLASLTPEEMMEGGVVGRWSVKDVLAHLADWEAHMLAWLDAARRGDAVHGPDPGLSWRQLKKFNARIFEAHRDQSLPEVLEYFSAMHARFMAMVAAMPEEEMLARGRYDFLAGAAIYNGLVQYAEHDGWGVKRIGDWLKARASVVAEPGGSG